MAKLIKSIDEPVEEAARVVVPEEVDDGGVENTSLKSAADITDPPWADDIWKDVPPPAVIQEDPIFRLAEKGIDMDKLERLIAMRERQEDRENKRAFDLHFAEMQHAFSALGPAPKTKDVENKYKYAPINTLVKHYGRTIAEHGFSFRFYETTLDDGRLQVFVDISGHGHTTTNSKVMPGYEPDTGGQSGKKIMNVLQAEGVRSTYGQRYVFIAGLGLVSENDDTDGLGFAEGVKYADYINALQAETDIADLREMGKNYYDQLKSEKDHAGAEVILAIYNKCKAALGGK